MHAIRVRKQLDSDTLHLPELQPFIGKSVDIIVCETPTELTAVDAYEAFFALAGQDVVDPDAYHRLRTASALSCVACRSRV